jgi:ketosteroid isomerase-like protein
MIHRLGEREGLFMTHLVVRWAALVATAMLGLTIVGFAFADTAPSKTSNDDTAVLLASEKAWADAAVNGDADRMASYMADEYIELAWEPADKATPAHWSTQTKAEWVGSVRSHKDVYTSVELRNLAVHLQGNLAVVTGEYSQKGTSGGKDISATGTYANTWVKRHGRWLVVHSVFP